MKNYFDKGRARCNLTFTVVCILLLFGGLFANAQSLTKRISIDCNQEPLPSVLKKIEKSSGFKILFTYDEVQRYKITASIKNQPVRSALETVLQGTPCKYTVNEKFISITVNDVPVPQNDRGGARRIRGHVYDGEGQPLPGATVTLKGTSAVTVTDTDGAFSMDLPHEGTLLVSFIGMESKSVKTSGKRDINIGLTDDANTIGEVVVTGLMNRDAKNFTGNASVYNGDELKVMGHQNIIKSLALLDPSISLAENTEMGSDPNTMPKIRFRGESSFQGFEAIDKSGLVSDPNQPLFILDGYETTMERIIDLDMNRVESVTVLKDAAAAAIYGARAANGVIVVKTKRPKEGQLRVSYTLDLNAELPDLSSYDLLNAKENMQLIDQLKLYRNTDGTLRPEYNEIAKWVAQGVDTDWMSQPLRNSFGTRHSLNLQGGDSRMRYGLDLNYGNTPGVMKESKRENYGIGVDLSYNANDRVLFNNYLSIYKTKSKDSPYGSFASYTTINQFFPIYDQEGQMYKYYTYPNEYGSLNNWWGNVSNIPVNPLYEANVGNSSKSKTVSFNENFSFDWRILESLRLNGRISYTHSENNGDVFVSPNSATYTDYGAGLTDLTTEQQMLRGRSTHTQTEQNGIEGNMFLTYAQKFGVHFITASAGSSLSDTKSVVYGFTAQGYGDSGNSQPSFAAGYEKGGVPQNVEGHARLASFFASANYSYDDRYLFDLSYRLDGSSSFGNDKKTAPFFSTGIGWNLHNEKFIKNLKCVDIFRLRATYGEVGSVNFSPYQAKDIYSYTTNDRYDGNIGALLQGLGNRNLKWQTTKSTEFGMQLGLFQLFDLQASYYNRLTKDMVLPVTTPPSVGFGSYTENLGEMRNRGWEVSLRAFVIKKPQLNVSLFASASHNSNKIMKISTALESFNKSTNSRESGLSDYEWGQMTHRLLTRYEEGQSTTAIYAVRSLGIDPMTGNEVFLTKEGHPTLTWDANDKVVVGDAEPDVRGNFGANVGWKGLYFNLTFQYQFGGQTYNQTLVDKVENSNKYKNVDKRVLTDTWQKPGDETSFKANLTTRLVQYYTYASSRFVQDYNLLQLAAMSLQYELPKKWISPLSLESVRLSFNTSDLGYWSTVKRERGTSYPYSRTFTFGLRVNF